MDGSALPSVTLLPSSLILERGLVSPESKAVLMVWTKPVFDKVGVGMVVVITKGSPGLGSLEQGLAREWGGGLFD